MRKEPALITVAVPNPALYSFTGHEFYHVAVGRRPNVLLCRRDMHAAGFRELGEYPARAVFEITVREVKK